MNIRSMLISAVLSVGLVATAIAAEEKQPENREYVVRKGDTLSEIAMRELWPLLWQYNRDTIANPNIIYPGQKILIPTTLAPPVSDPFVAAKETPYLADLWEVKYAALNDATFTGTGGASGVLRAGEAFRQNGEFTVKEGPLRVHIMNETELKIFGNSKVRIHGYRQEGTKLVRKIEVLKGHVQLRSSSDDTDAWTIEAAGATLEANNARVDVVLENEYTATFSTFDGLSSLDAARGSVEMAGNQGVRVTKEQDLATVGLPDAPQGKTPSGLVQGKFNLTWKPVDGVDSYYVRIAKDNNFDQVEFEGEVFQDTTFAMNIAEYGTYFWTVDAVNDEGFVSRPTPPARIDVSR